jgi:hypothetical protein
MRHDDAGPFVFERIIVNQQSFADRVALLVLDFLKLHGCVQRIRGKKTQQQAQSLFHGFVLSDSAAFFNGTFRSAAACEAPAAALVNFPNAAAGLRHRHPPLWFSP